MLHRQRGECGKKRQIPLQIGVNRENMTYLQTKAARMQHMLDLEPFSMLMTQDDQKSRDNKSDDFVQVLNQVGRQRW